MRYVLTLSRWSPCRMISSFFAVPPQAQKALSLWARRLRLASLSLMPSTIVTAFPHFLVSKRTRIRCCSFPISSQTQISEGNPHVGQISAMILKYKGCFDLYKIFNLLGFDTVKYLRERDFARGKFEISDGGGDCRIS
jgi:hypothetical protein